MSETALGAWYDLHSNKYSIEAAIQFNVVLTNILIIVSYTVTYLDLFFLQ